MLISFTSMQNFLFLCIGISFIFKQLVFSNITIFSFYSNQFFLLSSLILIYMSILKNKKIKINLLEIIFFVYIIYIFFNMLYLFDTIPNQSAFPEKYRKEIFLPYIFVIYLLMFFLLNIYAQNSYFKLNKWFSILMNIFFFHSIFVLILFLLYIVKLNPLMIGVDLGYGVARGFAFVTEPSYSAMISLISAFYFFKLSNSKFFVSVIAFLLTQSGTALLTIILILIIYMTINLNKFKTYLYLFLFIGILFLSLNTFFGQQLDKIIDFSNLLFSNFDSSSLSIHNPRAYNFIASVDELKELSFSQIIFGRGIGSTIYYLGSYTSSINFYPLQIILEGGIAMLILHIIFLITIYKKIKINHKYLFIVLTVNIYWVINGGAFLYIFYIIVFHIYYLIKRKGELNVSR